MNARVETQDVERYGKCIQVSKRIRWDIDEDVIRGRSFDFNMTFLPDGISKISSIEFLSDDEARFLSHIQGRTYANMFGLVERFINGSATANHGSLVTISLNHDRAQRPFHTRQSNQHNADYCNGVIMRIESVLPVWTKVGD